MMMLIIIIFILIHNMLSKNFGNFCNCLISSITLLWFSFFIFFFLSGGGFEIESHYPQWRRVHKPLEKYSTLQESLSKLLEGNFHNAHFCVCMVIVRAYVDEYITLSGTIEDK